MTLVNYEGEISGLGVTNWIVCLCKLCLSDITGYPLNVSLRIPLIWHHAGTIEPGVEESVVQVLDIAPTLLDYAGKFTFTTTANIPGESFAD